MLSNVVSEDSQKSPVPGLESIVSVLISNYPLSNGGYLVSFGQDGPDGSFENYDPSSSLNFEASKLANFLEYDFSLLPKGCYYLCPEELGDFICSLSSGASYFKMELLPASARLQGLLLVKVNEASLIDHEQEEED